MVQFLIFPLILQAKNICRDRQRTCTPCEIKHSAVLFSSQDDITIQKKILQEQRGFVCSHAN